MLSTKTEKMDKIEIKIDFSPEDAYNGPSFSHMEESL
jgi:hypothetical protein